MNLLELNQELLEALRLASNMLAVGMPEYDAADVKDVIDAAIAKATWGDV